MKTATLIYNPVAGRVPERRGHEIEQARALLEAGGLKIQLARTSGPGAAADLARRAADQADLIVVCGGDGTINEVINSLVRREATLAILPGGTANIAARELRLPLDPVEAARAVAHWTPRRIALGLATWSAGPAADSVRERYFLSIAGVGFDAYIVHKLSAALKTSWGVGAYVCEAFRQWARYGFPRFTCRINGRELTGTFAVVQRTSLYAGWLRLAPGASLSRDQITLCLFESPSRMRYLAYAGAVLLHQHSKLPDVELIETREIICSPGDRAGTIYFEVDGELAGRLPATFRIARDALTLLAPWRAVTS